MFFNTVKKLGFTMIELLIVIAVLGILAVAVLSAINPIEQINRGKDTGSRSDAEQILSAIDRYYTTQGYYPWMTGATDTVHQPIATLTNITTTTPADTATTPVPMLTKLSTGGSSEIKSSFVTRISNATYNTMQIYTRGTQGDSVYVCFVPKSGAFKEEAKTRCGTAGAGMPADMAAAIKAVVCDDAGDVYSVCLP